MMRKNVFICKYLHKTVTQQLAEESWKSSSFITCPHCFTKAICCEFPQGIQDAQASHEWFVPLTLKEYAQALEINFPRNIFTLKQQEEFYETAKMKQFMYYRPIKKF
jgi:hypothetical protein